MGAVVSLNANKDIGVTLAIPCDFISTTIHASLGDSFHEFLEAGPLTSFMCFYKGNSDF